jgi:hypothetical protein
LWPPLNFNKKRDIVDCPHKLVELMAPDVPIAGYEASHAY